MKTRFFKVYFMNGDIDYISGSDFWLAMKQAGYGKRISEVQRWEEK